jgi:hypothetical protein
MDWRALEEAILRALLSVGEHGLPREEQTDFPFLGGILFEQRHLAKI